MLLRLAIAVMAVVALAWLGYEFWRLLCESPPIWPTSPSGAVDLKDRHAEVRLWFSGQPVYAVKHSAMYPPATYVMLWPLVGWLPLMPTRLLWAITTLAALAWLIYLLLRESGAETPLERLFVALMPLAIYATGATIEIGRAHV